MKQSKDISIKKILLTGGSGLVGRNFIELTSNSLLEIDSPNSKDLNLLDFDNTFNYLRKSNPDLIIHAAGKVGGIQANIKEPFAFFIKNLDMGRNLIIAAKEVGVKKILNLGSSCMYPKNREDELNEEQILSGELEPTNEGYALAKVAVSRLCDYISRENNYFQYKTLVPCNLYGKYDKYDETHSHLIAAIIQKVHNAKITNQNLITIWGDGSARREFLYAGDFAEALLKSIHNFDSLPNLLNIGVKEDYTILQYYEKVAKVLNYKGSFAFNLDKPVGMKRKKLAINKQLLIDWSSKTDLEKGIELTYNYYLKSIN